MGAFAKKYSILIMGDSHMARIDPKLLHDKTKNLASPGEHYFYTYSKLKTIVDNRESKIKTIVIGIGPHNFSPIYQKLYDLNTSEGRGSLENYLYFINFSEAKGYSFWNFITNPAFFKGIFTTPVFGGWYASNNSNPKLSIVIGSLRMHYNGKDADGSSSQIFYLEEIIKLCNEKGIKLIGLSTPVHPEYKKRMPKKYLELNSSLSKIYSTKMIYLNYFSYKLSNIFFADGDHLNILGSKVITSKVDSILISTKIIK